MIKYIDDNKSITNKNIEELNKAFGSVDLSVEEERSLQWLAGFEPSTVANIISAFSKINREDEPRFLLDEDSICYGCIYYTDDEDMDNCTTPNICIEGNMNGYRMDD